MRLPFVIALAAAFIAGGAATALSLSAVVAGGAAGSEAPASLSLAATIGVGGAPSSLAVTEDAVWASLGMGGIVRIDPATNRVVARVEPDATVIALAVGFGSLWAVDVLGDRLLRIDQATNEVVASTRVGGLPSGVAVGFGSVWVANQLDSTVTRIDPGSGRVLSTTRLDWGELWPGGITAGPGGIWVVTGGGNEVSRIDPTTAKVDLRLPVGRARSLATVGETLWVGLANERRLLRIDARGMSLVRRPGPRANGFGPELAGGSALSLAVPGHVARLRPAASLRLARATHVSAITTAAGDVWIAEQDAERVLRIDVRAEDLR
jgi:DNA-binding beta-propeller fold protein YncE